jgi:hypothetical protein
VWQNRKSYGVEAVTKKEQMTISYFLDTKNSMPIK